MPKPVIRLHLVAPAAPVASIAACFTAACETGDVASILSAPEIVPELLALARRHDVALLTSTAEAAKRLGCDGVEVASREAYDGARALLGFNHIVGAHCGASRHQAMELADAGADYIAFSQSNGPPGAEPIIAWWSQLFEIPAIAADPAAPESLAALLSQGPDFIRPADEMWRSPGDSLAVISATMRVITDWGS